LRCPVLVQGDPDPTLSLDLILASLQNRGPYAFGSLDTLDRGAGGLSEQPYTIDIDINMKRGRSSERRKDEDKVVAVVIGCFQKKSGARMALRRRPRGWSYSSGSWSWSLLDALSYVEIGRRHRVKSSSSPVAPRPRKKEREGPPCDDECCRHHCKEMGKLALRKWWVAKWSTKLQLKWALVFVHLTPSQRSDP
jgi:hypothetical protein